MRVSGRGLPTVVALILIRLTLIVGGIASMPTLWRWMDLDT